jgi:hypothetical protein
MLYGLVKALAGLDKLDRREHRATDEGWVNISVGLHGFDECLLVAYWKGKRYSNAEPNCRFLLSRSR